MSRLDQVAPPRIMFHQYKLLHLKTMFYGTGPPIVGGLEILYKFLLDLQNVGNGPGPIQSVYQTHLYRYPRPHWVQTNPRQFWAEARLLKHAAWGRSPRTSRMRPAGLKLRVNVVSLESVEREGIFISVPSCKIDEKCHVSTYDTYAYDVTMAHQSATRVNELLRARHSIDIRYHFIKDHVEKGNIELYFVESDLQLADLFTKAFDEKRHYFLLSKLGMLDLPPKV
ncbi:hypothetical protein OSB04_025001 [Centaurea solstitialis]|uniref:Uncharacterized protein n=1 Tax=Centaurea solstitialis TaxID=347529 RepID=A0AA38SMA0_9ASTR|nr:hypothetical protein OSB04_025001 [Centaurea solstitialis]